MGFITSDKKPCSHINEGYSSETPVSKKLVEYLNESWT